MDRLHTADEINSLLSWNQETGEFYWKVNKYRAKAGSRAGTIASTGYRRIVIDRVGYFEHRLLWFLVHNEWPEHDIDHVNGQKTDNRLENLRKATRSLNNQNRRAPSSNNKNSGMLGVYKNGRSQAWMSKIQVDGKIHYLGSFKTKEEAQAAYLVAKRRLHPGGML